jgi:hypothetical protein
MTVTSISEGEWSTPAIWSTGSVPISTDDVVIQTKVTITANVTVASILIGTVGSLLVKPGLTSDISVDCPKIEMNGNITDSRRVLFEGAKLVNVHPCISCIHAENGNYWATTTLWFDSAIPTGATTRYAPSTGSQKIYSMSDTSPLNRSAVLEDQLAKGNYNNGTISTGGGVPNLSISVQWPRSEAIPYREILRRMTESPYQVLAVTPTTIIKGYIEQIQYTKSTDSYFYATISVVEGVKK